MERAQPIRPTQFITTYGPGALLESLRGPVLINGIAHSGLFTHENPGRYEIVEPALSQLLPEQGQIFRLPSNAERDQDDSTAIYDTRAFPRWSLCVTHSTLYRVQFGRKKTCPGCQASDNKYLAWEKSRQEAVTFVMACTEGHMDDVPWDFLLHQGQSKGCQPEFIRWRGAGGPLRSVTLSCPDCPSKVSLADLYHREHRCSGHYLERDPYPKGQSLCDRQARITQRGASNLFLPEVRSSLTLPRTDSDLDRAMRHNVVLTFLTMMCPGKTPPTDAQWGQLLAMPHLPDSLKTQLSEPTVEELNRAAMRVLDYELPKSAEEVRSREFHTLCEASRRGHLESSHFQVLPDSRRTYQLGPYRLAVTPVSRLRVVMAQVGYRRLGGSLVECGYQHGGNLWFPGVELFGEGLFLQLDEPLVVRESARWSRWEERHHSTRVVADHPEWVWWHTLSHRLIRSLAIDSGYSAASVKERLYLSEEGGGVLLYAVQPGGDGTLGGLIALVERFESVIDGALQLLDGCSNDPLCGEQQISPSRYNGAACYACSLLSETVCEMRNHSLDRKILVETLLGGG